MYELLLLTVQRIDDEKVYLYAMELEYHNILRIVKSIEKHEECLSWSIGKVTMVDSVKEWSLEKNTYVTSGDRLTHTDEYKVKRLIANKVSYPARIISGKCMDEYRLLRISKIYDIKNSIDKIVINAALMGSNSKIDMVVLDHKWITYWKDNVDDITKVEKYKKLMSFYRNHFIAIAKNNGKEIEVAGFLKL
ncbi:MAG: hypothetical protein IJA34_02820 [Lachnospiraceae bacterium]|nr:hypothetical protein [Lachnospiraceae bacterium]